MKQTHVVIIGAGPAGLTAAYELLQQPETYRVTILEEDTRIGGISKTVAHAGNHRGIPYMPQPRPYCGKRVRW